MSNFVGTLPFLNLLRVAMETMHFSYSPNRLMFWRTLFCIKGVLDFKEWYP